MNADPQTTTRSAKLQTINRELADILKTKPASLAGGAEAALEDDLVVCGILGGKDVGKSTLINALAETRVSANDVEVGRGTDRPIVYVHSSRRDALLTRLERMGRRVSVDVTCHQADAIRNVALVDLPDFDSEFMHHLEIVREIAPLLDRILWVLTPRKVGDRAWVAMFEDVIKDPSNVHCVLNKIDELLTDHEPFGDCDSSSDKTNGRAESFWRQQDQWLASSIEAVGCPQDSDRRFLLAAAFRQKDRFVDRIGDLWNDPDWKRYAADRQTVVDIAKKVEQELDRLRGCVLGPVSTEHGRSIKLANEDRQQATNLSRIESHYELTRTVDRLEHICKPDYARELLDEAFDGQFASNLEGAISRKMRADTQLADELLAIRVQRWPLLRLVHWPFGWAARCLGRITSPILPASTDSVSQGDAIERGDFEDRAAGMRVRILSENAAWSRKWELERELPATEALARAAHLSAGTLPRRLDTELLDHITSRDRRPSFVGRAALWFILFWFPIVQPVSTGLLEMFTEEGAFKLVHGLYRIVSALSAVHLLAGFGVVGGIYLAIVAGMYVRALSAVRSYRGEEAGSGLIPDAVDDLLSTDIAVPLLSPFRSRLERLTALRGQLDN